MEYSGGFIVEIRWTSSTMSACCTGSRIRTPRLTNRQSAFTYLLFQSRQLLLSFLSTLHGRGISKFATSPSFGSSR